MVSSDITVAVLQPGYLPWLGFFDQMRRASVFVVYDDVQYDKHGWRNRNRIKTSRGPLWLTVPTLHGQFQRPLIMDVRIDSTSVWQRKHVSSLRQHYARARYARAVLPELEDILQRPWVALTDLNLELMAWLARWLKIETRVVRASTLDIPGERSERLLSICRHFGATRYLSGDAAREYLDTDLFHSAGVEVIWQQYRHPLYTQLHGPFVSHLSAVDLVLNCGPDSADILAGTVADKNRPSPLSPVYDA
jgi:hypothetical protein